MRERARVVVIGGGNMGASVLYHLAKMGWNDCVLIEKAELTSGATWHAAGLVSSMVGGHALGILHDYAVDLYKTIEAETGQAVSWHGCGSLRVATSEAHMDWIQHLRDAVLARRQQAEILAPVEVAALNPLYDVERAGVLGALYTPDDGHVDPAGACFALAKGARLLGAEVIRHCRVTDVQSLPDGTWRVATEQGEVLCEHVVNAGGYHARQIGAFSGLDLPITTMMHHYVLTDAVPRFAEMEHEIPVTRDDYFCGYIRREQGSALIGLYDKQDPQAVWLDGCPWGSENELFEANWDGIAPWLERCFERCPELADLGLKRVVNGGITYTPDGAMLLGPAPGLQNYWLACGATVGIAWGPGAGRSLAEWMVEGSAAVSTRAFDPRRFGIWADADYARARAVEDYTLRQAMPYPQYQRQAKRGIRRSGAESRTAALGALFEEAAGWERPRLYGEEPLAWRRSSAFQQVAAECRAVRERVGLGDFSAFAKFEIAGPDAAVFLDRLCANRPPKQIGGTSLTLFLNRCGTIEGEATLLRSGAERFYLVTGAPSERRLWDWLQSQRADLQLELTNRSDEIGILVLAGPRAASVLRAASDRPADLDDFPWLTAKPLSLGGIELQALRLSFTGELAFELHAPNQQLGSLWDSLWQAGEAAGIAPFGSKALDSLRLEKGYRGGHELSNDVSPKEVGQMRFVKLDRAFLGRDALLARQPSSRIALVALEGERSDCLGGEAVFQGDQVVGSISSAAYGHCVGRSLAFAFLQPDLPKDAALRVSLFGERVALEVLPQVPHDPQNLRLRGSAL